MAGDPNDVVYPPDTRPIPTTLRTKKPELLNATLGLAAGREQRFGTRYNHQEDALYMAASTSCGPDEAACFGVFDGHGGTLVSEHLSKHLCQRLVAAVEAAEPVSSAVEAAVVSTYEAMETEIMELNYMSGEGSCAATALFARGMLIVANCGDCEAWLCRAGRPHELTEPHKASMQSEMARIHEAGGRVILLEGVPRAAGALAVSRAFGDRAVKEGIFGQGIVATPHVQMVRLQEDDEFLLLGSDGLYDVFPNRQDLVNAAKSLLIDLGSVHAAAKALADMATDDRGSADNTTVILVALNQRGVSSASACAAQAAAIGPSRGRKLRARTRSIAVDISSNSLPIANAQPAQLADVVAEADAAEAASVAGRDSAAGSVSSIGTSGSQRVQRPRPGAGTLESVDEFSCESGDTESAAGPSSSVVSVAAAPELAALDTAQPPEFVTQDYTGMEERSPSMCSSAHSPLLAMSQKDSNVSMQDAVDTEQLVLPGPAAGASGASAPGSAAAAAAAAVAVPTDTPAGQKQAPAHTSSHTASVQPAQQHRPPGSTPGTAELTAAPVCIPA